jgi:hypothetical protein
VYPNYKSDELWLNNAILRINAAGVTPVETHTGRGFESLRVSCDDKLDETTKALKKALS